MTKKVYCKKCNTPILHKEDLVTATVYYDVFPYHSDCYVTDLKGPQTIILGKGTLNGFANNFKVISISIIAIFWAILADPSIKWTSFVAIPFIIYRLYAYIAFERHVK